MHIEPGVVDGARIALSYATAAGALALVGKLVVESIRESGFTATMVRSAATTGLVFSFFEVLPHQPVGVSEVHLILGSTLLLLFGAGPAAIGLAAGLLVQGLISAPTDLPQYGMNVTTLIVPLYGISLLAKRIISPKTPYVDLRYRQALALSTVFQGGVVAWVAFWAFYGQGFTAANISDVATFSMAYMSVIAVEPVVDLGMLALSKALHRFSTGLLFHFRLHQPA